MNIRIKATNIELTPAIEEYVTKKFESLSKFISNAADDLYCYVDVGMSTKHHKKGDVFYGDVNMKLGGAPLYARVEKDDLYAAIDELKDQFGAELKKTIDKMRTKQNDGGREMKKIAQEL